MSDSQTDSEALKANMYLTLLLNKTLRITTSDERMFLGEFKCTDNERNIILARTYEYRRPPPPKVAATASSATGKIILDMQSRYIGLVVVPGTHVVKIEVEEFTSQLKSSGGASDWSKGWQGERGMFGIGID